MRPLFACALALGLLSGPALAAPQEHHGNAHPARPAAHRAAAHPAATRRAAVHRTAPVRQVVRTRKATPHRTVVTKRATAHHVTTVHRKVTVNNRGRADIARYRKVVRAPHRFHVAAWRAPRGFAYRRFSLGERIPGVLLAAEFFLASYAAYGLEAPPSGYVWVRDGDDAVLVDRYTGEVIAVEYDVFY